MRKLNFFLVVLALMLNAVVLQAQSQSQPRVTIGSKSFTESVVLGDLLTHLAANAGARVEHRSELGGTQVLWKALLAGDIDAYVDYTGTIREQLLADVIKSGVAVHSEADMRREMAKMHVVMSDRIGFNNHDSRTNACFRGLVPDWSVINSKKRLSCWYESTERNPFQFQQHSCIRASLVPVVLRQTNNYDLRKP